MLRGGFCVCLVVLCLGTGEGDPAIGWIEVDQRLSYFDVYVILDVNGTNGAVNARSDGGDMTVDLGIVGALIIARI